MTKPERPRRDTQTEARQGEAGHDEAPLDQAGRDEGADLSLPEWITLAAVNEQPTHGFAIAALTRPGGPIGRIWQIPRPLIYRAIGRLAEAGLIAPEAIEPGLGPQRTRYAVTAAGQRIAEQWLTTPVRHVREVRSHLLLKLVLLDRLGRDRAVLLADQRAVLAPIAAALAGAGPQDDFDAVLLAWRRASVGAALAFLDDVASHPIDGAGSGESRPAPGRRSRARSVSPRD